MLRSMKDLMGYKLVVAEGPIGKVKDFLFDEEQWTVRWMVADTGDWLPGRQVLVSPITLGEPDWYSRLFPVRMTKNEIESAPGLSADEPVSREYEKRFFDHFAWPYYWEGMGVWGDMIAPGSLFARQDKAAKFQSTLDKEMNAEAGENVLRSTGEVMGYDIQALNDAIGHVEDFIVEDESWTLRYMVVDTRNWLPGRKVLVSPSWVDAVEWAQQKVFVGLRREEVKGSPEFNPSAPVNREYETRLYDYYGRPAYWRT